MTPRSCFPTDQNRITLYNVPVGTYHISSDLQLKKHPYTPYPNSRVVTHVQIHSMENVLPTLSLPMEVVEVGLPHDTTVADIIHIPVTSNLQPSFPYADILHHLECCLSFFFESSPSDAAPVLFCTPIQSDVEAPHTTTFSLSHIPQGRHTFTLHLRNIHTPRKDYSHGSVEGVVDVRHMEEFLPSYEWTPLHAWHTIPSGLQTR